MAEEKKYIQTPLPKEIDAKYVAGVYEGDGKSGGAMVVLKNGGYYWHTKKLWKAKLFIWWLRLFNRVKIIKEKR